MDSAQNTRGFSAGHLLPLAIALLAPAIVLASAGILLGLLAIFVAWLIVVTALVAAIVISDLARHWLRRLAPAQLVALNRAVGFPGR